MKKKVYTASVGSSYCIIEIKKKINKKQISKYVILKQKQFHKFFLKNINVCQKSIAFGLRGFLSLVYPFFFSKVKP